MPVNLLCCNVAALVVDLLVLESELLL